MLRQRHDHDPGASRMFIPATRIPVGIPAEGGKTGKRMATAFRAAPETTGYELVELTVRHHPGMMSHLCGLLFRRGFAPEAMTCAPPDESGEARVWMVAERGEGLERICTRIGQLHDVRSIARRAAGPEVLERMRAPF